METDKRKHVINAFLGTFVSKGLSDTTSRDLAKSLKLQNGGLYYYFESKDSAVIACAEEAIVRLEEYVIVPAINDIEYPDKMIKDVRKMADEMAPTMRFLMQVCSSPRYAPILKKNMENLFERYKYYANKVAIKLGCEFNEVAPYFYMGVMIAEHYMLFGEQEYVSAQIEVLKDKISSLIENSKTRLR